MATDTRSPKRRQTSASTGSRQTPAPAAAYSGHTISWRHCLIGLVAGELALLLISNVALIATNKAFGSAGSIVGGVVGVSTLVAVIFGGWLAARLAGRFGLYQGIVVAIGFIAVGAVYTFFQESSTIASSLATNSHHLIDLGPMDLGNLFSGDLLALFGGSVGGLLSGKR
jgi:hypothetical protein